MNNNPVGWFEIYVQDMVRAKAFYTAVFGKEFSKIEMEGVDIWAFPMQEGYGAPGALVHIPGVPCGGGSDNGIGTMVYFSCEDCAVQAAKATESGGQIHKEKMSIGQYGHIAMVIDTEGNMIGLHSMN